MFQRPPPHGFLLSARTTAISLIAIPLSLAVTALVFQLLGQSINVMTLGGLATTIVVLVFVPLFALPGIEGRLFAPLGIPYIVSILASMLVSMTMTPVLSYYLLPQMKQLDHGDTPLVQRLKAWDAALLAWSLPRAKAILATAAVAVVIAAASVPCFPRAFLPAFNEGSLVMGLIFQPGTSLAETNRMGALAETLICNVPEVAKVGRVSFRHRSRPRA